MANPAICKAAVEAYLSGKTTQQQLADMLGFHRLPPWLRASPTLRPSDIVIMDNLSARKNPKAAEHIRKCGADVFYLPAYSPDLNPIENMWSTVKQLLRGMEARAYDTPEKGLARALELACASDAQGWFKNCGYELFQI